MKGRQLTGGAFVLAGADLPPTPTLAPQLVEWQHQPTHDVFVGDQIVDVDGRLAALEAEPGLHLDSNRGVVLHPDVYLNAAQLNVDDLESVVAFLNVYGTPSVDPRWTGSLRLAHFGAEAPPLLGLPAVDPNLAGAIRQDAVPDFGTYAVATRAAVLEGFRTIRFLVEAWAYLAEGGPAPTMAGSPQAGIDHEASLEERTQLASLFAHVLDSCLGPVCPRAFLTTLDKGQEWLLETPPLLAVLALQLAHHIARGSNWGRCKNERCGRLFDYQQSRHQEDPDRRRAGALYCTETCSWKRRTRRYKASRRKRRREHD
jgi:hypothetical protein